MSSNHNDNTCKSVVQRAIAVGLEQRDKYWRTNADIAQLERQLKEFSQKSNEHLNPTLVNATTNIEPVPALRTGLPYVDSDGKHELLCDETLNVCTQEAADTGDERIQVAHAVPADAEKDMTLELDMTFAPLTQIGATTLHMQ